MFNHGMNSDWNFAALNSSRLCRYAATGKRVVWDNGEGDARTGSSQC